MRSSAEAVAYAKELHKIVTWIGICDGNMQEGSFRCDANVSVRKPGAALGTRREIKNLNSFKFMQQAIDYEVRWQIEQLESGHSIQQATVLFDPDTGETRSMRNKEDAADYRYFPDPDLPPLVIGRDWVARKRAEMAELPRVMAERFVTDYGLPPYDANQLTQSLAMANYFEVVAKASQEPKLASNWVMGEVSRRLNAQNIEIHQSPMHALQLASILVQIAQGLISNSGAKQLFDLIWNDPPSKTRVDASFEQINASTLALVETHGLKPMNDTGALEKIIDELLANNPKNVAEFKAGNDKALNALVGQAMKASQGKANPAQVNELLRKKLA
jgi:aspartyl-tRNA(Asn)/glutamyl-tRNA(Gln) amidotransferase subunit B